MPTHLYSQPLYSPLTLAWNVSELWSRHSVYLTVVCWVDCRLFLKHLCRPCPNKLPIVQLFKPKTTRVIHPALPPRLIFILILVVMRENWTCPWVRLELQNMHTVLGSPSLGISRQWTFLSLSLCGSPIINTTAFHHETQVEVEVPNQLDLSRPRAQTSVLLPQTLSFVRALDWSQGHPSTVIWLPLLVCLPTRG